MHKLVQNTQLSVHFRRDEFACKCGCGFSQPDPELIGVLEQLRNFYQSPVLINSACRCESHNAAVKGAKNSAHKQGIAADVVVKDVSPDEVYDLLTDWFPDRYGIGSYNTFVHLDVRAACARWIG